MPIDLLEPLARIKPRDADALTRLRDAVILASGKARQAAAWRQIEAVRDCLGTLAPGPVWPIRHAGRWPTPSCDPGRCRAWPLCTCTRFNRAWAARCSSAWKANSSRAAPGGWPPPTAHAASSTASKSGPAVALYSVPLRRLPPLCQAIVDAINGTDDKVFNLGIQRWYEIKTRNYNRVSRFENIDPKFSKDMTTCSSLLAHRDQSHSAKDKAACQRDIDKMEQLEKSLNPDAPGSMRSWHQNDSNFLPHQAITGEGLVGKATLYHAYVLENKGLMNKQKKKGVAQTYTGYIEFTAGGWANGVHDGRFCRDDVGNLFYFAATHDEQRPGREDKNPWWQPML